jgi:hypothetical protein
MLSVLTTNSTSLLNADISHAVIEKVLLNFNFEQLNLLFQVLQQKTIRYSIKFCQLNYQFSLRILRSAMPVALLYVGKLIIDQVALNTNSPAGNLQELWQLVALEFALALLTDGLNRMINLTDSLLGDLFSNYTLYEFMLQRLI